MCGAWNRQGQWVYKPCGVRGFCPLGTLVALIDSGASAAAATKRHVFVLWPVNGQFLLFDGLLRLMLLFSCQQRTFDELHAKAIVLLEALPVVSKGRNRFSVFKQYFFGGEKTVVFFNPSSTFPCPRSSLYPTLPVWSWPMR